MHSDLASLKMTDRDLERLSGLEITDLWVGGLLVGVYRPPIWSGLRRSAWFVFTELVMVALVYMFSLPLGFAVTRHIVTLNSSAAGTVFLGVTVGITGFILVGWHLYRRRTTGLLQPLLQLLTEIDRFHQVLAAVDTLANLAAIAPASVQVTPRAAILAALQLTRDNLVAGLMTEKILRDRRGRRAHQTDLLAYIEQNLATLSALAIHDQARDYGQLINDALQIGISVQRVLHLHQDQT